ncbi:MAG: LacI family DNA-binding transcriptional regulator [Actinomycetales bacterium]
MPGSVDVEDPSQARRRATIYEIARAADVSHQSVSRYMRGLEVRASTKAKIEKALETVSYRPNLSARTDHGPLAPHRRAHARSESVRTEPRHPGRNHGRPSSRLPPGCDRARLGRSGRSRCGAQPAPCSTTSTESSRSRRQTT